jgi:hypothetical protein
VRPRPPVPCHHDVRLCRHACPSMGTLCCHSGE